MKATAQIMAVPGGITSTAVNQGGFETPALPASPGYLPPPMSGYECRSFRLLGPVPSKTRGFLRSAASPAA